MENYLNTVFYSATDYRAFMASLQQMIDQIKGGGVFTGDNLFTYSKSLSFLEDEKFMSAFNSNTSGKVEEAMIWRFQVLVWAAERGLKLEGDLVQCGVFKGNAARVICDYLDIGESPKSFFLYDAFDQDPNQDINAGQGAVPGMGIGLYDTVVARFADLDNVAVHQIKLADAKDEDLPKKISFLHIGMNDPGAEVAALHKLFENVVPGAFLVLEDYGWLPFRLQKEVEDVFFEDHGYRVLELPTGQGLVIK